MMDQFYFEALSTYLWWFLSVTVLLTLWIATKIPWVTRTCEAGLLSLGAKFSGRIFSKISAEIMSVIWLVFGRTDGADEDGESTYSEQTLKRMVNVAIAIDATLVILSFVGSFTASRAFALTHGISSMVAFAIPLVVDGGALLCIVVIFIMALAGLESQKARIGLMVLTSVSVLFNVAHISENGMSLQIFLLGVIFPGVLFGSTELLADLIRTQMRRSSSIKTLEQLRDELEGLRLEKVGAEEQLVVAMSQVEDARQQYAEVMEQVGEAMKLKTNGHTELQKYGTDLVSILQVAEDGLILDELAEKCGQGVAYVKTTLRYLMTNNRVEYVEDKFRLTNSIQEVL